jgi:deoxyribonuclease-1-like protein
MKVTLFKNPLRPLLLILAFVCCFDVFGKVTIASWNLQNFGTNKKDWVIDLMAQSLKDFDVVAIQEINTGPSGSQAVGKLVAALNRTGNKWSYSISEITTSGNRQEKERYAFLWKAAGIKLQGKPYLASKLSDEICREPFIGVFKKDDLVFTLVNIHAIPKKKQPETELKYLKSMSELYPGNNFIFLGDFNCPESHTVFSPLKKLAFMPALKGQKTTLKQQCKNGECLASAYDNIFYSALKFTKITSNIVPFYTKIQWNMARFVSDHIPVFVELE